MTLSVVAFTQDGERSVGQVICSQLDWLLEIAGSLPMLYHGDSNSIWELCLGDVETNSLARTEGQPNIPRSHRHRRSPRVVAAVCCHLVAMSAR
jgi:hypothetical protein